MVREKERRRLGTAQLDDGSSSDGDKNKKEQVIGKR